MSTVEERFELARKSVENIAQVTKDMHAIGVYDEPEYKAAAVLLITLTRAMVVLDPEKTRDYSKQALEEAKTDILKNRPDLAGMLDGSGLGQYL
ncbi:hypothetical protein SEA_PHREDRICK_90 [Streptomyces phage Phredrick]|jgi:hypothetical protein|nr:hypothetical protein SEA_KENREY_92 [Streptomyces phage Kenrey]WNN94677.1 hypothetical protein SEA_PHREDRICK_90 [Streptomyces phage Phredrick]